MAEATFLYYHPECTVSGNPATVARALQGEQVNSARKGWDEVDLLEAISPLDVHPDTTCFLCGQRVCEEPPQSNQEKEGAHEPTRARGDHQVLPGGMSRP